MQGDKNYRFPRVPIGEMNIDQRRVAEKILSTKRMNGHTLKSTQIIPGPFNAWMQTPDLAGLLEPVGEHLRFNTSLPARLSEFVILITARHWDSQYEWYMHREIAVSAGLKAKIADDLASFRHPVGMADDEAAVYAFCTELHSERQVSDATFSMLTNFVGHRGVIEVIVISGYYGVVSMTLNVAEMKIPARAVPLPPRLP